MHVSGSTIILNVVFVVKAVVVAVLTGAVVRIFYQQLLDEPLGFVAMAVATKESLSIVMVVAELILAMRVSCPCLS